MNQHKSNDDNPWRAAGLASKLGFEVAGTTSLGYGGGWLIRRWLEGSIGWLIAGVLLGLFLGITAAVISVKKFLEDTNG